jgi:hypothetical protein
MNETPAFWFPAKLYGWGWGLPVRWQGWLVFAVYLALLFGGLCYFEPPSHSIALPVYIFVVTAALVLVVAIKGERPAGWRWGNK